MKIEHIEVALKRLKAERDGINKAIKAMEALKRRTASTTAEHKPRKRATKKKEEPLTKPVAVHTPKHDPTSTLQMQPRTLPN